MDTQWTVVFIEYCQQTCLTPGYHMWFVTRIIIANDFLSHILIWLL